MGTRSVTYVYDTDHPKTALVCMYRQMDGYPSGHGKELAKFLAPMKVINGISGDDNENKANGAGCLAAQMVAHFKTAIGQFYLVPTKEGGDHNQEYEYRVYVSDTAMLRLAIKDGSAKKTIFDGTPTAALKWINDNKTENV